MIPALIEYFDLGLLVLCLYLSKYRDVRDLAIYFFLANLASLVALKILPIPVNYFCIVAGLISCALGLRIHDIHRPFAVTCYLMVGLCIFGWHSYKEYNTVAVYATLCLIISIVQAGMIIYRAKKDGIFRCFKRCCRMVGVRRYDFIYHKQISQPREEAEER